MQKVDLRTVTMDIPAQEVITKDNVTIRVNAVAYFRVLNPDAAVVNVADFIRATSQIAQTTLRSVLGQSALDDLLAEREKINQQLAQIIDDQTEPWGIKVSIVEVKDVELPQSMQRAMARQAEAEREKRAKIIHAEGEFQASQQLGGSGRDHQPEPGHDPAALPADAERDRIRAEHHGRLPAPDRHDQQPPHRQWPSRSNGGDQAPTRPTPSTPAPRPRPNEPARPRLLDVDDTDPSV